MADGREGAANSCLVRIWNVRKGSGASKLSDQANTSRSTTCLMTAAAQKREQKAGLSANQTPDDGLGWMTAFSNLR